MAANSDPVMFGATVVGSTNPQQALRSPPSKESTTSSADAIEKEMGIDSSNPFSAFYNHPEARRSFDEEKGQSKAHLKVDVHVQERDLEAGVPLSAATTQQAKVSVDGRVKECTMWPSRQAMVDKQKAHKRAKGCNLFKNMNSKQRLWLKIIIGLLIVAAAVGLGVGISKAVGGGVWAGTGQSKPISQ